VSLAGSTGERLEGLVNFGFDAIGRFRRGVLGEITPDKGNILVRLR